MKREISLAAFVFILGSYTPVSGQDPVQFDAATITLDQRGPGLRGMNGGPGTGSPGRVTWRKAWLMELVSVAFNVKPENISGPSWISRNGAQLYMLTATMPPDTSRHDFELMLQRFLIEQFRMKLRHELRMFPSYDLVIEPGGSKLKASADPNAPDIPVVRPAPTFDSDGFPVLPPGHGQLLAFRSGGNYARFQSYPMSEFVEQLGNFVSPQEGPRHYVVDKTGLTGAYDITLKFDADRQAIVSGLAAPVGGPESEPSGLPNIFKALERQLGLKLVKGKDIPMDTIVIDQAERIPLGN